MFIQTQPMEEERVQMGWQEEEWPDYVHYYYKEEDWCRELIAECDVLLFGGCDDESYIQDRLRAGKLILRYCERMYKNGQWKAISPRGLVQKYKDHTRYRKAPVYLLCAGGYVASDYAIIQAYPNKKFCWGYFPEAKKYDDIEQLLAGKGYAVEDKGRGEELLKHIVGAREMEQGDAEVQDAPVKIPYLLWAARFIDWKHPERAIEAARYLKNRGYVFRLDMIGGGELKEAMQELIKEYELEDCVSLIGYRTPKEVRGLMEKADIFLMTSDRQEGWGAVANEAMNSGCALVADHLPGAVPFLVRQGHNGYVYEDGNQEMLNHIVEMLLQNEEHRRELGRNAYETITTVWNAENAAESLLQLIAKLSFQKDGAVKANKYTESIAEGAESARTVDAEEGNGLLEADMYTPCAPAPVISERYPKEWAAIVKRACVP